MPSLIAHSMKLFSRIYIRHNPRDPASLVAHLRRSMNHSPLPVLLPPGVRAEPWQDGALRGDRLVVARPGQVILYLHGGGYVCGKTRTYFNFCSRLAAELQAEVLLPDYRLAPEHPFPAAIHDAVAAYEHLLGRGWRPDQVTIAGDSAGGGLTLGTLLALRDQGRPMPRCAVLISPFADVRAIAPSIRGNDASDFMLGASMLEVGRNVYAQTPRDAEHPWASPALGDYSGLPPLFITVCEHECLRDDAYAVEARARAAGVPVTLLSRPDLFHVWPIFAPMLPEARQDLPRIANFIRGAGRSARIARVVTLPVAHAPAEEAPLVPAKAAPKKTAPAKAGAARAAKAGATATTKTPAKPAAAAATEKPARGKAAKADPAATTDKGRQGDKGGKAGATETRTPAAGKRPAPKPRSLARPAPRGGKARA